MKKRLVALLAGLLTVLSLGFGLAQFSDVPAGHWAKEAVEAVVAKGILTRFPDGTFRGNEPITRYQAALIIYRLLQQIEEELKAKGTSPTMEALSPEDLEALKNAIQELAAELAALGVRVSALEDSAATKEDIARLEAMIEELKAQPAPEPGMDQAALQDLLDRVEAASIAADTALAQAQQLAEQLDALAQDVEGVKGDVAALATQVEANAQAIQELAAELAALGVRVSALEDSAATKEDIARLEAMIEELKAQPAPEPGMDQAALQDLLDRVEAASIAADTALAQAQQLAEQLEALAQAVEGVKGDLAALSTQVEANAQAIQALNELAVLLNQDVLSLLDQVAALEKGAVTQEDLANLEASLEGLKGRLESVEALVESLASDLTDRVEAASIAADTALAQAQQLAEQLDALAQDVEGVKGDVAALATQVEANAQAIQALNELAVLLNLDVLSLQDRVTALEKGLADLQGANLEQFATKADLEELATKEDVAAVQEFAAALRSDLVTLSEKVSKLEGTVTDLSGKVSVLERNAFTISGSLTLTYTSKDASNFSDYDVDRVIGGTFVSSGDSDSDGNVVEHADSITSSSGSTKASLSLKIQTGALEAKSSPGGYNAYRDPRLVQFSITGSWTDPTQGMDVTPSLKVDKVATTLRVADGQQLSFVFGQSLNTKFTEYVMDNESKSLGHGVVATLKGLPLGGTLTAVYGAKGAPSTDYVKGLRLAFQPGQNLGFGLSYAQHDTTFEEVAGVDASADLGIAKVSGEYFRFGTNVLGTGTYSEGGYVMVELPQLLGLKANYRGLASNAGNPAGLSLDDDNPFRPDQRGFTVEAGLPIAIAKLGLLYNVQMDTSFGTPSASAFKASLDLGLPAGFSLSLGATLAALGEWFPSTYADGVPGPKDPYDTAITATFKHDGKAENALVKGLNLTLAYTNNSLLQPGRSDSLAVFGDFGGLALGPLSVDKVIFRYSDSDLQNTTAGQTLKGGIRGGINLAGLPLNPSLTGEFAARVSDGDKSETKFGFGLKFSQFLFDKSVLEVKAAQYSVRNLSINPTANDADKAFDPTVDMLYSNANAAGEDTLSGVYVTWTYWDLSFAWAFFKKASLFSTTWTDYGRAFQISYKVTF
jgi:predicted  nucleic acid-binding Zn-ribbon protein